MADLTFGALAAPAMSDAGPDRETAALVARARDGDASAFGALVDRHYRAARRVAAAALPASADCDDVVQEACVTAWQRLSDLADPEAFRPWLQRIVWRKALDRRRTDTSWLRRFTQEAPGQEAPPARGHGPEAEAIAGELDAAIRLAVRSLPTRYRDPFLLAAAQDHRYDDIARLLRLPVGTVKWRVFEARRIVRAKLAALGHEVRRD
ncbi:MAG: RNA polymerase sigma factor [Vicinamibacterales bacterium]